MTPELTRAAPTPDQAAGLRSDFEALMPLAERGWWGHGFYEGRWLYTGLTPAVVRLWLWARFCKADPVEALASRHGPEFTRRPLTESIRGAGLWRMAQDADARLSALLAEVRPALSAASDLIVQAPDGGSMAA